MGNNIFMKKIFALICVFFIFGFCVSFLNVDFSNIKGQVTFVTNSTQNSPMGTTTIQCGDKNFVTCDITNFQNIKSKLKDIQSFTLRPENLEFSQFSKRFHLKIVKTEKIDDKTIIYGYCPNFSDHIVIEHKFANVQIVVQDKTIATIGVPAILDSF